MNMFRVEMCQACDMLHLSCAVNIKVRINIQIKVISRSHAHWPVPDTYLV